MTGGLPGRRKYNLDNVESDICHLNDLINVIVDLHFDGPKERIGSLLWIARDLAGGICKTIAGEPEGPQ